MANNSDKPAENTAGRVVGEADRKDKRDARNVVFGLMFLSVLVGVGIVFLVPALSNFVAVHFSPGLGLKDAAVWAFFVTVAVLVVFAITAGDGLLGELQFMLSSFFLFFVVFWLMLAWIF